MANKYIWIATVHNNTDEYDDSELSKFVTASESLLTVQSHVLKKVEKFVKYQNELGDYKCEYVRKRRGNLITIEIGIDMDDEWTSMEWYEIRRVKLI